MKQQTKHTATSKKDGSIWRILRTDGELVGSYETKSLALKAITKSPWFKEEIA